MNIATYLEPRFKKAKRLIATHDILMAIVIASAVILVSVWMGYKNARLIPAYPGTRYGTHDPLSFLGDWDGQYYLRIARYGYTNLLSAGFYPLYPILIRGFHYIFRSYLISALFISWVSFVAAVYYYIKIARQLGFIDKSSKGLVSILPFIFFPTGIFLIAAYTEGLYAALALASIYFSLRRRYVLTGIVLLLANLTHITGVFLIVLDAIILWEQKEQLKNIAAVVLMGAYGAGAFMGYLYFRYHNPLAFIKSQTMVHQWLGNNYHNLIRGTSVLNVVFAILLITSAIYYWQKRKSFAIYSLLFLVIPLVGRQWGGFDRYVLMAFPIPLMIYEVLRRRPNAYLVVVILCIILWTYTLMQFTAGYIGS